MVLSGCTSLSALNPKPAAAALGFGMSLNPNPKPKTQIQNQNPKPQTEALRLLTKAGLFERTEASQPFLELVFGEVLDSHYLEVHG